MGLTNRLERKLCYRIVLVDDLVMLYPKVEGLPRERFSQF